MIKIFDKNETDFTHDGLEVLDDIAISSYTDWSEGSKWVIQAKFKKDNIKSEVIQEGSIIQVDTEKGEQLFRILKKNTKNRKYITISGHAIGYDFNDNFIHDINIVEKSGRLAVQQIANGTVYSHNYNITSNIDRVASARMVRKNGLEALIDKDKDNTFINRWGGYLVLDNFNIAINEAIGEDRGVEIAVGKNVIGYDGDIDEETVCTGINPIIYDGITLPEGIYYSPLVNNYSHPKIREIKFDDIKYKYSESNYDEEGYETLEEVYEAIREACDELFNVQNIDKPTCSLRVDIAALESTDQYKGDELYERIFQGDILTANLEDYGFDIKLKMVANRYDNIRKRYIDIDLGDAKKNIFKDIVKFEAKIDKVVEQLGGNSWKDILDKSMNEAANLIAEGVKDSYVVARKNEILIMDDPVVESAINVIRMNKNGIAFSQNGYNGPYTLAITIDGKINASCILTGELTAALIKTGIITSANGTIALNIDDDYLEITHTEADTRTRLDAEGFYILDNEGETIASLSSKESWTELKADKVFANNIENVYTGDANLYVNHSKTVVGDGTSENPFNSFNALQQYLQATPIVNKDIYITIQNPNEEIAECFSLEGLKGSGRLNIYYDKNCVIRNKEWSIYFLNVDKDIIIKGGRTSSTSSDGALFVDTDQDGNGIWIENCGFTILQSFAINCEVFAINVTNTNGYSDSIDFCDTVSAIRLYKGSQWWDKNSCGNCSNFVRVTGGSIMQYGHGTESISRANGTKVEDSGRCLLIGGEPTVKSSLRVIPPVPPTSIYNKSFSKTGLATYQYKWSSWKSGEAKQGIYGSYGNKAGHIFFNTGDIRGFIGTGTVLEGNTITLTRRNGGGNSGATNIYINASSVSSASGTPSYAYNTLLGTLKWGETKTFTLPKTIVDRLKNGTSNSLACYSSSNGAYAEIVNASINIKINK